MAIRPEEIGILAVHGIGEQRPLYHLRETARELETAIKATGASNFSAVDQTAGAIPCIVLEATFKDPGEGEDRRVRIHVREIFWADLGANGPLLAQIKFWLWGLGQWAAHIAFKGSKLSNTTQLMVLPRFGFQASPDDPPGIWHRIPSRLLLLATAFFAFLAGFTWTAVKEALFRAFKAFPNSSLIYRFLGDVMQYERGSNPDSGEDSGLPTRTTIRRRMIRGVAKMASGNFDRWYIFAHSLGCIPAFNALQETEIALPNYLTQPEWEALPGIFKIDSPFVPKDKQATTKRMMPHRPAWLVDTDGINRKTLFGGFAGLVTYGSPLDKFAALWPRIVCLNRQTQVFPPKCEWVNFHDATDPVSARLDAFDPPPHDPAEQPTDRIALKPVNIACRASPIFLLSHIRYFTPRRDRPKVAAAAIARALLSNGQLSIADAAKSARIGDGERRLRAGIAGLMAILAAIMMLIIGALVVRYAANKGLGLDWPFRQYAQLILIVSAVLVLGAGLVRTGADYRTRHKI